MGLLNRSYTLQQKSKGLLKRIQSFYSLNISAKKSEHFKNISQNITKDINFLNDGIDSPFFIFNILKNHLNFNKGCFLFLSEQNQLFIPAIKINISNQSLRSLEQPQNQYLNLLNHRKTLFIDSKNELKNLKQLFSGSDYNEIKNLLLFPFFLNNNFTALLILCNMKSEYINILNTMFINRLEEIVNKRYSILSTLNSSLALSENELKLILNKKSSKSKLVIKLTFDPIINTILEENDLITANILKQDLYLLFSNYFRKSALVYKSENNCITLIFNKIKELDIELLNHQINIYLKEYYKEISGKLETSGSTIKS